MVDLGLISHPLFSPICVIIGCYKLIVSLEFYAFFTTQLSKVNSGLIYNPALLKFYVFFVKLTKLLFFLEAD